MFEEVLKSIFPVPSGIPELKSEYAVKGGYGHTTCSREYWDSVSETPTDCSWRPTYVFVDCREHGVNEAVPRSNMYDGWLDLWYNIGLHPRWNIWGEVNRLWPTKRRPGRWPIEMLVERYLKDHADDPEGLVKAMHEDWYNNTEVVSMRANGRTWQVTRTERKKFREGLYTPSEFLHTNNQTMRQLMLLSRSFEPKDILSSMDKIEEDEDGALYTLGGMTFLHVKDASTDEDYLLSVPRRACKHGQVDVGNFVGKIWHGGEVGWCEAFPLTPKMARRWTLNVPFDAEILLET